MKTLDLNQGWKMREAPLCFTKEDYAQALEGSCKWYPCMLPVDVHMPLMDAGEMRDPVLSDYCREAEWVEDRSWWFVKHFEGEILEDNGDVVELSLSGLDARSDVFLNGQYLGCHKSVHYPFVMDVKPWLKREDNLLVVRMTSGLEEVKREDVMELLAAVCLESSNGGEFRGDARRSFVRRPQYTVGWDWGPKVTTIGITGGASLASHRKIAVREVHLETLSAKSPAKLHLMVNVENLDLVGSKSVDLGIEMKLRGKICAGAAIKQVLATSGYNYIDLEFEVEDPQIWWPNGYGSQPMYTVKIEAVCNGSVCSYPAFDFGIRTIRMDTGIIEGEDRNFTVIVNDQPIYCKGGNWVPNDFLYARVSAKKYKVLISEAVEANFNMMRVWGGGLYERDFFYDLCDKSGILLWHDFMFACSTYPDHHRWFRDLMWEELDYQTKRLRNHCCLALFCGTNEVHWIFNSIDNPRWGIRFSHSRPYGLSVPNKMAKEVIRKNCPAIFYWNSSPYGGKLPNEDTVGDVHRWHNALMSKKMKERIEPKDYDTIASKFVSEYGFIGPCCLESTIRYMDGNPMDREGKIWHMHSNVFEKGTVNAAIEKNYVDAPETLSLEEYLLYGGMAHALMYGYSLESMRFKKQCSGGLFWMYNDAWGEVGWTIVDYYLRRKIPYYAVKRSLAHRKFTLRAADGKYLLQGINDTPESFCTRVKMGYVTFDGSRNDLKEYEFTLEAGSRSYLAAEPLPKEDFTKGTIMLYVEDREVDSVWLRMCDMRNMSFDKSAVTVEESRADQKDWLLTVRASGFAHGVHIKGNMRCSDNYFDLLPSESRTVRVMCTGAKPIVSQVR